MLVDVKVLTTEAAGSEQTLSQSVYVHCAVALLGSTTPPSQVNSHSLSLVSTCGGVAGGDKEPLNVSGMAFCMNRTVPEGHSTFQ